jgi:hypothetical protein
MRPLLSLRGALSTAALLLAALLLACLPAGAVAHADGLVDEPLIPGLDWSDDFQVASNGDVYVAEHGGAIYRYRRAASSTVANPTYVLNDPQLVYRFQTTQQYDRGLVGITLDSDFDDPAHHYLYALITRGSVDFVDGAPNGNPNGVRRTGAVVRIAVPATGAAQASDLKTIVGADAPADPDASCKPFTKGMAAAYGDTEAAPNGVAVNAPKDANGNPTNDTKIPAFSEANVFPDGDLATRADGAYDCVPSDGDTHGLGEIASAPDGSLYLTVGDSTPWQSAQGAALRSYNLESYAGKVLHIDRSGKGVGGHPFCPAETDLARVCTKVWAIGLRNAFRFSLLPADRLSGGGSVLALGDVGNYSYETLTVTHPGDNLGWPCWEGTYFNYPYAQSGSGSAPLTAWGGPALASVAGRPSCARLSSDGVGAGGNVKPSPNVTMPSIEYAHDQGSGIPGNGAAIVAGPRLAPVAGADPKVALPASWNGSLFFTDYVRSWVHRIAADPTDPANDDADGGLRLPGDDAASPNLRTETPISPYLDQIATGPLPTSTGDLAWGRLTMREGRDGTLWYMRYQGASRGGAIYRLRHAPEAGAKIDAGDGICTRDTNQATGAVTFDVDDAGPGATYAWDIDGDGIVDAGRTARTTTIAKADLPGVARHPRVFVTSADGSTRATDACYFGAGTPPDVRITAPVTKAQIVLGDKIVVSATRAPGDAAASGIPDADLRWQATTVHGSSHEHLLAAASSPFETVSGVQKMQFTIQPDSGHELGSYTRVRIYAPQSDVNSAAQTIRLYPKPVTVTLRSAPAGATVSMARDIGSSVVDAAPGSIEVAAGYVTTIAAAATMTGAGGAKYTFSGWSDGQAARSRAYRVPADGGEAPVAQYAADPVETTPPTTTPTTPVITTPAATTPAATTPVATTPVATTPTTPAVIDPSTPAAGDPPKAGPLLVPVIPKGPLAPTGAELKLAPFSASVVAARRRATITGALAFGRPVDSTGLVLKAALRSSDCRWWSFGRKAFVGPSLHASAARVRKLARRACTVAPGWKQATATWTATGVLGRAALGGSLPRGRYALRVRVKNDAAVLVERVAALQVR